MTLFTHQTGSYLTIAGANIYYQEIGNKDQPALVLLHGGLQNMADMNIIAAYFQHDFRIIGIDSRGHGKSTLGNVPLSYERLQLDVEAILQHLNIQSVIIIGFSDGGTVGYRMAASNVVHVEKLIAIGASWSVADVVSLEPMFKEITAEFAKQNFTDSFEAYQQLNPAPQFNTFTKAVVTMWGDKTSAGHPDTQVENIKCPVLLIRGDNDFLTSLTSLLALKQRLSNAALLNVAFAEHVVYQEQALICQKAIEQFITKQR